MVGSGFWFDRFRGQLAVRIDWLGWWGLDNKRAGLRDLGRGCDSIPYAALNIP